MRRLRYTGDDEVLVETVADPVLTPGTAIVRVLASAVCGSERSALANGMDGNAGHEAAGTIVEIAPGSGFAVGDRVGVTAVSGCGRCDRCSAGRETQCRETPVVAGGWHAELLSTPISALRRIPDSADAATAVLMSGDALGVPARAARRVPHAAGETVIVIGLGPVGLGHVLVRSWLGAHVIGVEPSAFRRDQALLLGAAEAVPPGTPVAPAPLVIDCTGVPSVIESAFDLADSSGTVLQSGECHRPISLVPSDQAIRREITYTGSWYYASEDYPFMTELVADGLPLPRLCTDEVEAEDAPGAIRRFLAGETGKVLVRWS